MPEYDVSKMLYPEECPAALQRWGNSLIRQRVGGKRVAGWRWDGVSQEIVLILAPGGMKLQTIGPNTWAAMFFPKGTLVVQDVYGGAIFKVVDHRRGDVVLQSDVRTYHQADTRHLTIVGVAPQDSHPASKPGDATLAKGRVGVGHASTASFLGQGESSTPLASVSEEAALDHLRRMEDSEGNEDSAQGMPGGRSAAGSVRPDPHSAAAGLGEDEPVAASSLPPRMPIKEETCS